MQHQTPRRFHPVLLLIERAEAELGGVLPLGSDEPQLGLRQDKLCAPRLIRAGTDELLVPEGGAPWSVQISTRGSLDNLVLASAPLPLSRVLGREQRCSGSGR